MNILLKYLFIILVFSTNIFAQADVTITSEDVDIRDFNMSYYVDESGSASLEEIKQKPFINSINKISLGTDAKTAWAKISILNQTNKDIKLFIHHPYAYHNKSISFFEEQNGTLLNSDIIDLDHIEPKTQMYRGTALFEFDLNAGAEKTIYIKSVSFSHQWFTLLLFDADNSKRALINTHNDITLLIGVLLALMVYNFLLYLVSRNRDNIYYSLYLISAIVWISLSYGLLANVFNVYGSDVFKLHLSLIIMPIFLILFLMSIFETKKEYPTEHKFLLFILVLLILDAIYGLFDIVGALKHASSLAALMMIITISVSISLYKKKNPIAKYFLIGHIFFFIFNIWAVLFYKGIIGFTYISSHGVGIGIMLEALTMAFIIAYRIKILEDIKKSQVKLELLASTDPLTKLYNRRHLYSTSTYILDASKRNITNTSVIMLDIDSFKKVNDIYGHQIGDDVLVMLSLKLKELSRSSDIVCRFGGEEFVILLPDTDIDGAVVISQKIRQAVEKLEVILETNTTLNFTVSIGVSQIDHEHETDIDPSIKRADVALYKAKNSGKNRVIVG